MPQARTPWCSSTRFGSKTSSRSSWWEWSSRSSAAAGPALALAPAAAAAAFGGPLRLAAAAPGPGPVAVGAAAAAEKAGGGSWMTRSSLAGKTISGKSSPEVGVGTPLPGCGTASSKTSSTMGLALSPAAGGALTRSCGRTWASWVSTNNCDSQKRKHLA